jgi:quinol monooxygenase YgiN
MSSERIYIVTFKVKPEYAVAFAVMLKKVKKELPKAPGCTYLRILHHADEEATIAIYEGWESKDHHLAYVDTMVASGAYARIKAMLAEPPSGGYWTQS